MQILIVTRAFPPLNTMGAGRPYSWAKYWSRAGHDVTVLTTPKSGPNATLELPELPCRVLEVPVPGLAPLRRLYRRLAGRGGRDVTRAEPADGDARSGGGAATAGGGARLAELGGRLDFLHAGRLPTIQDLWIRPALGRALRMGTTWDLVISSCLPYATHVVAAGLRRRGHARRWIADYRDLWASNPAIPGFFGFREFERRWEDRLMRHADVITTVSESNAQLMRARYGSRVHVVTNGFDPEDLEALPSERIFPDDGTLRLVYTGSIYRKQDVTPLLRAVRALVTERSPAPTPLEVVFAGPRLGDVPELVRRHGIERNVRHVGLVPRADALRMQRDADALVFIDWSEEQDAGMLTGKIYEYLFGATPILCVGGSERSVAAALIRRANAGHVFAGDVAALQAFLRGALDQGVSDPGPRDRGVLRAFTREVLAARMLELGAGVAGLGPSRERN